MKIHEYQAKEILKKFNVPIQEGYAIDNSKDIDSTIKKVQADFNSEAVVVKAQIHAGGRGKGGGVKYCPTFEDAQDAANTILGMNLITHQTGPEGKMVNKILITEALDIEEEYYFAITFDRSKNSDVFIVSKEGGVDIEEVAENSPEKIIKSWIDDSPNALEDAVKEIISSLSLEKFENVEQMFKDLYRCYIESDCSLLEINPLVSTTNEEIIALDAKVDIDSNSLFRHPEIAAYHDKSEEDPLELQAAEYGLNYIKLDGNVGCMVNGAGLAMATMDIVKHCGGEPANFLDVGGAANVETIKNGFKIILSDKNVKSILINIFGGIVRCDRVANGVIQAVKELELDVIVVVRLQGTNAKLAKKILDESDIELISAETINEAATKAVEMIK
ncbi:MAG: ADP-forming succinate--CoA ligase subunit beta [Candidatus Marinimicrobia bacterium]|jgi:succinyl-CoA synthetase beta subunit|nr:ADP-forming succinate--CoA ligase subunit beta [Candidatus Neomarinimicrobiota bacterium]MBT3944046.1 ADP-forming succinate--CoA ligase subunit beta [Candidatus Neomarinimicrobiota bacterium]MBT4111770.1 ADP-forming succinate--CoA ligase subunit beta [Candidatus Neomarinimicrobiota bacterium]MBT4317267.1 ADP-forming succinate--CoA ligase subunit beta [Candidatus Neomarinimicrobiota bacterium]MBT4706968.1 ADP-forming succinate--CoA ligase subunit beta [Candidatus Neomarinimicrobiota bacterium